MSAVLPAAGPSPLWYLTRATGVVSLLLLTAVVVLGVTASLRLSSERWPRFLVAGLHRNLTLLALAFLAVHIGTTVADNYVPITLKDVFIPFVSAYRPIWVGLGAVAFDLLLALVVTSLLRARVGVRLWRGLHWLAYVSWPVALVHGLGTGSDAKTNWMIMLTVVCIGSVALAVLARVAVGGGRAPIRMAGVAAVLAVPLGIGVWYTGGPLQSGWAARSGTPATLLGGNAASSSRGQAVTQAFPQAPFDGTLRGRFTESGSDARSLVTVDVSGTASPGGGFDLKLAGQPLEGGGVQMTASSVAFGSYTGQITALQGTQVEATLHNASGTGLALSLDLNIDRASGAVTGSLHASNTTESQ
jgi:DMSO/TMAO reductase YedYZ heme-binding membrane subunit